MPVWYPSVLVKVTAQVFTEIGRRDVDTVQFIDRPRSMVIERNDFRTCDTATLEFDAGDFPILPRNISQALVQVYFGDVGRLDESATTIQEDRFIRFIGYIDFPEISLSESDSVIRWKARDYTALFLDVKRPSVSLVPTFADRLDVALRRIVDSLPGGDNIEVVLDGATEWPELSTIASPGLADAKIPVRPEDTLWDLVLRACDPVGLIPEIRLDQLVVHPARGLGVRPRRGYFAYGNNIAEWKERRDLNRMREGIGLRAYSMETSQWTTALWPPVGDPSLDSKGKKPLVGANGAPPKTNAKRKPLTTTADGTTIDPSEKRKWFNYDAVPNQAALLEVARNIYETRSRMEFEGTFVCADMAVPEVRQGDEDLDGRDFDVTGIATGDRVVVELFPEHRALLAGFGDSASRVAFLVDGGYEPSIAALLVRSFESGVDGALEVYVRSATHTISESAGYKLEVHFQNLITTTGAT